MANFATIADLQLLWRPLRTDEIPKAEAVLTEVSESLRYEAIKAGKDLDEMIETTPSLEMVAKSVTCDVTARKLMSSTDTEPMSQMSQSAGGYSVSGTFLVPGGGLFIKKSELARLGLRNQKVGVREFYIGNDQFD
jgi:hypothetical protein